MLLRANCAAAIVLTLMGVARTPLQLVLLRVMQGCFTGTMTAAQAMVAVHAPSHRSGAALGALSAAVFSGTMVGAAAGGFVANWVGYRPALLCSGWILVAAALLIVFGTTEDVPAAAVEDAPAGPLFRWGRPRLGAAGPILLLSLTVAFVRQLPTGDGCLYCPAHAA
jgi:DHA1 family multidrug resistance protein-like MFS transporter